MIKNDKHVQCTCLSFFTIVNKIAYILANIKIVNIKVSIIFN